MGKQAGRGRLTATVQANTTSCPTHLRCQHPFEPSPHQRASERLLHAAETFFLVVDVFECGERVQSCPHTCCASGMLCLPAITSPTSSSFLLCCLPILDMQPSLVVSSPLASQLTRSCFGSLCRRPNDSLDQPSRRLLCSSSASP
jgi:hypothetical protein